MISKIYLSFAIFFYMFNQLLVSMETDILMPKKILIVDDKFPVYTRDFINEEIRALIESKKFSVSLFSETIITDQKMLDKLPDWMKQISIEHTAHMPEDLNVYNLIFAYWGHLGEKIAYRKHTGDYHGILVTRFRGCPEEHIGDMVQDCYPYLKQYGNLYLPNCAYFKTQLIHKFDFNPEKCMVHSEPVDIHAIQKIIAACTSPKTLDKKDIALISVCRLEPKKGLLHALHALATVRMHCQIPFHYTIVGEGSLQSALENCIHTLGLDSIVTLVGGKNKKEVIQLLLESDVLLAPSYTPEDGDVEGTMNVLKEAALTQTVIIATDHAGSPELIEHNKTGVLAKQNNIGDLTEKIVYVLTHGNRWAEWCNNVQKKVEDYFDGATTHPQLIEILLKCIDIFTAQQ